ncbi:Flp family type IVb pilin [Variovorax paradoxus]|nr:Flp family type IVb pilin [Variovorax paradoxus]MBT2303026.1 Flp family type IVb pilin [Variovorax paradoxus]
MLPKLLQDDEGAQVVEYALIIAIISIALVLALEPLTLGAGIDGVVARVAACVTGGACA